MDNQKQPVLKQPKPEPKKGDALKGGIILAVIAAIIVIAIVLLSGGSSKKPSKPVAATANTAPTKAQQVSAWYNKYAKSSIANMSNDLTAISKDGNNPSQLAMDCGQLLTDSKTAQAQPPVPDNDIEQHWGSTLTYYHSGAQDCTSGVNNHDANQLSQATTEFNDADAQLGQVNAAIKQL
ncbi:MAG: hypothetical protein ACREHG_06755 [Candidatus Saccharimonadales bacterium]